MLRFDALELLHIDRYMKDTVPHISGEVEVVPVALSLHRLHRALWHFLLDVDVFASGPQMACDEAARSCTQWDVLPYSFRLTPERLCWLCWLDSMLPCQVAAHRPG